MKKFLLSLILLTLFFSCKRAGSSITIEDHSSIASDNFDWLSGDWERVNEEAGKQTLEQWTKVNSKEYHGFGFTMRNSDTILQEEIKLIYRDSVWNFEVTGTGEDQATIFRIINIESNRFASENPENDFPKVISYYREGNKLNAVISGDGIEIPFEFEPVN